jgi:hypothetical protein
MNEHILIPILAIVFVFSIPIIAIIHYYKQKKLEMDERTLMIEKGIMPPPLGKEKKRRRSRQALEDGLYLLGIGLGFFIGLWVEDYFSISRVFAIGGSILLFLGIANILIVFLAPKIEDKNEQ